MSMDYDNRNTAASVTEAEGVMFAARPIWERGQKRRSSFGARKAAPAEARSFAPAAATAGPSMNQERPASRSRATRGSKMSGSATAAIAAGVVAVGALGAGAWFLASQDEGVPELAAGAVTTEVAAAPLPPSMTPPAPTALPEPKTTESWPAQVEPPRTMAREERRTAARTRPAAAPSAGDLAVNASATTTLPEGPQPYTSLNPGSAPGPVNPPMISIPPATSAAPAPSETPEPIPDTPPISTDPATAPGQDLTAPQDTTPPTS